MKDIIRIITFLLIFSIGFYIIFHILWLGPTSVSYFYKEPKNSLDIVYIGSSNAYAHFNTTLAYHLYGYTTGMLSSDTQTIILAKYLIKESEKTQKPSLYIIDLAKVADTSNSYTGEEIRKTIDSMKFSKNRIDAINEILDYKREKKEKYINYYFSFLMYHNKWKDINKSNIIGNKDLYKGYLLAGLTTIIMPQEEYNWTDEILPLQEENRQVLNNLIEYIKNNKINVLFVVPNRCYKEETNKRINDAIQIIEQNNLKVINCNTVKELDNIDFSTDLYNSNHLNVYGATKYTLYMAKYLKENYELTDHRNDSKYKSWQKEYERFKKDFNNRTNKNFEDLLIKYDVK